jgi:hypothetical protein
LVAVHDDDRFATHDKVDDQEASEQRTDRIGYVSVGAKTKILKQQPKVPRQSVSDWEIASDWFVRRRLDIDALDQNARLWVPSRAAQAKLAVEHRAASEVLDDR